MPRFGRVLTAMVTPFDANGDLNVDAAVRLAKWLVEQGNEGLVVCGTTGESPTLSIDEKLTLFETVASAVTVPILAGTTGYNTGLDIGLTEEAGKLGIAGVLAVCPFYSRPSQAGLETHFRAIAGATDLPVVLYDIPIRTGRKIDSTTIVRLAADVPNIVGVKDAAGNPGATAAVKANAPGRLRGLFGRRLDDAAAPGHRCRRRDRCGDALVCARSRRDVRRLGTRRRAGGTTDQCPPVGELRVRNGRPGAEPGTVQGHDAHARSRRRRVPLADGPHSRRTRSRRPAGLRPPDHRTSVAARG